MLLCPVERLDDLDQPLGPKYIFEKQNIYHIVLKFISVRKFIITDIQKRGLASFGFCEFVYCGKPKPFKIIKSYNNQDEWAKDKHNGW